MFEWDTVKNRSNQLKRGVSFEEASLAFQDPLGLDGPDVAHSDKELRFLRVASSSFGKVLTIVYTLRSQSDGTQKIRLISARKASKKEKLAYESEG